MKYLKQIKLILLLFSTLLIGCGSDDSSSNSKGTSSITVRLMDNPGDFENVFVEVVDVMVKIDDTSDEDQGWQSLDPINTGVYDLLELTGGLNVLLVDDFQIPSGTLNQIRLVLGENNSIVIDGETLPLNTPSAQQSGLKIQVNETLDANIAYTFLLDFDVDESIVIAGNSGNINLKPIIRASIEANSGAVSGSITPASVQTEITATNGLDIISAFTDENGLFVLTGLSAGTYTITVTPDVSSEFSIQTFESIEVSVGNTTDLGVIVLE